MKRLFKILSTTVTVIMLAALVVLMCMGWLNISGKAFHLFGYAILRVQTSSMVPTYEEGDFLLSEEVETSTLKVGDVITFYSRDPRINGMLNTHRITAVDKVNGIRVFTTKGDAAEKEDSYKVSEKDVFGKVQGNIGFLKWLAEILSISWVFAIIVFFPLLLLIAVEVRNILRLVKRGRVNKRLKEMGLDPDDPSVSALVDEYGIDIFINAENEIKQDKTNEQQAEETTVEDASEAQIEETEAEMPSEPQDEEIKNEE